MPSKKPMFTLRTDQENIDKLKIIADIEGRSDNKQLEYILKKFIESYENQNGTINIKNIVQINDNTGTINM